MSAADDLAEVALFGRLSPQQRATVTDHVREVTFAAGTRLFEEHQQAVGCWVVRTGRIALTTAIPGRGDVVVQTLGPGEVLGWSWLVAPHRWHFAATATGQVTALEIDTDRLRARAEADPALGYPLALGLFEILLARLQHTRARLLDLYGSPRER